jgi:hypothetical protein
MTHYIYLLNLDNKIMNYLNMKKLWFINCINFVLDNLRALIYNLLSNQHIHT